MTHTHMRINNHTLSLSPSLTLSHTHFIHLPLTHLGEPAEMTVSFSKGIEGTSSYEDCVQLLTLVHVKAVLGLTLAEINSGQNEMAKVLCCVMLCCVMDSGQNEMAKVLCCVV